MTHSFKRGAALTLVVILGACGGEAQSNPPVENPATAVDVTPVAPVDPIAKVQAWRDKHEADYLYEWVSIAGLHFLAPGTHTVGSAATSDIVLPNVPATIGRLVVEGGTAIFEPERGVAAVRKGARVRPQPGQPADEPVTGPVVMHDGKQESDPEIAFGAVRVNIHTSGGALSLRVRDPRSELAAGFLGFKWFPIDEAYRVIGRFIPDGEPREMQVLNTLGVIDTYETEGVLEFEMGGEAVRLRPFTTRPKRFYIVFRDASAGVETYKTARFLYADLLDDGTAVLDFNEAYNPPCAFNPYTTCPIPLRENILPVKILAGEQAYPLEVKQLGIR